MLFFRSHPSRLDTDPESSTALVFCLPLSADLVALLDLKRGEQSREDYLRDLIIEDSYLGGVCGQPR